MNRIARSIITLGVLLGSLWFSPLGLQTAAGTRSGPDVVAQIGFSEGGYNVTIGDSFPVVMIVVDADALGGWETTLAYDPSVVSFDAVTAGAFLTTTGRSAALLGPEGDPESGQVALGGYSWGTSDGVSGEGEIATVEMHAVAIGASTLDLIDPLLASVLGADVTEQEVEVHTALVKVYAAPVAAMTAIAPAGSGIEITWQHAEANTLYRVWRSSSPYFTPGQGGSTPIASGLPPGPNCTMSGNTITCTDPGVLAASGQYYYVVQSLNPAGAAAISPRMGAFVFAIEPGD